MKFLLFYFIWSSIMVNFCFGQRQAEVPYMERTTAEKRLAFKKEVNTNIEHAFSQPADSIVLEDWKGAFWATNLILRKDSLVINAIETAINKCPELDYNFCRWALESANTIDSDKITEQIFEFLYRTNDNKLFAMGVFYLWRHGKIDRLKYDELKAANNMDDSHPIQKAQANYFNGKKELPKAKELSKALINHTFPDSVPVFYSFQRRNRNYAGLTIIRKPDGRFLKDSVGDIVSVPQLARAISNMPGYLTNGNSPQGILAITGTGFSENVFIGPTETLITRLPFEGKVSDFIKSETDSAEWRKTHYKQMVPEEFHDYSGIWEAYLAGKAGRTEIISHGTTINPQFYEQESYHPNTPSLGCLTAYESWDEKTGKRLTSNQEKLINIWKSLNAERGYFLIIDLDNKEAPVTIKDLDPLIDDTETNSE